MVLDSFKINSNLKVRNIYIEKNFQIGLLKNCMWTSNFKFKFKVLIT